jgi:hypothetical protein
VRANIRRTAVQVVDQMVRRTAGRLEIADAVVSRDEILAVDRLSEVLHVTAQCGVLLAVCRCELIEFGSLAGVELLGFARDRLERRQLSTPEPVSDAGLLEVPCGAVCESGGDE